MGAAIGYDGLSSRRPRLSYALSRTRLGPPRVHIPRKPGAVPGFATLRLERSIRSVRAYGVPGDGGELKDATQIRNRHRRGEPELELGWESRPVASYRSWRCLRCQAKIVLRESRGNPCVYRGRFETQSDLGRLFLMAKSTKKRPKCPSCGSHDLRRKRFKGFSVCWCDLCGQTWLDPAFDDLRFDLQHRAVGSQCCVAIGADTPSEPF